LTRHNQRLQLTARVSSGEFSKERARHGRSATVSRPEEEIGGRIVVAIDADEVTLADRAGTRQRVRVGQRTPFD